MFIIPPRGRLKGPHLQDIQGSLCGRTRSGVNVQGTQPDSIPKEVTVMSRFSMNEVTRNWVNREEWAFLEVSRQCPDGDLFLLRTTQTKSCAGAGRRCYLPSVWLMEPVICGEDFRVSRGIHVWGRLPRIRLQSFKPKTLLKEGRCPGLSGGHSCFPLPDS